MVQIESKSDGGAAFLFVVDGDGNRAPVAGFVQFGVSP